MKEEQLIQMLINLSKSDKDFDNKEFAYILTVAEKLGLDQDQFETLVRTQADVKITAPPSEHERMRIFYYLLFLMKIDQKITEEETELVHHFGFRLGFSRAMINDFIDLIRDYREDKVPREKMLNIIRKYNN